MSNVTVKFVFKKISKVRWRPLQLDVLQNDSPEMFVTGSWDDEDNSVCLWRCFSSSSSLDTVPDKESLSVEEPTKVAEINHLGNVTDLKFASSDLLFASSSVGSLTLYNCHKNLEVKSCWDKIHNFKAGVAPCTGLAVSGNYVSTVGEDGKLIVHNFDKEHHVKTLETNDCCALTAVTYLRYQEVVTGNTFGYLRVWDLRTPSDLPARTLVSEQAGIMCMCSHPMQPHILATGDEEGMLSIWDMRQDKHPTAILDACSSAMTDMKFHPSNPDYMFSSSIDGTLLQWNASSLKTPMTSGTLSDTQSKVNSTGNCWLNCDASKHRLEILSHLPSNTMCVNSLDVQDNTVLCGTDNEAIYLIPCSTA